MLYGYASYMFLQFVVITVILFAAIMLTVTYRVILRRQMVLMLRICCYC